ncbi:MAG: hypothetical protein Q4A17_01580 [Thermoguttaceae bacterium]|nr:hypothetical protein [Thermoguttaceae bacterium]
MKRIKQIIGISLFAFVFLGSFINNASARSTFSLGKALCNPTTSAIQEAKTFNAFTVGQKVDLSPTFGLTKRMRVEKTIGRVHAKTVIKAGLDFDNYLKIRGLNSTAGKTFEESYRRSFNNMMTRQNGNFFIENTATLGKPHDSADLLVINKTTNQVELKIQQKLSADLAMDAITNPKNIEKYKDCDFILTTSDQLEYIKRHLPKDPVKRKVIEEALESGRLTDKVLDVQAKSMNFYQEATERMYKQYFNNLKDEIATELSKAIRNGEEFIIIEGKTFYVDEALEIYRESKTVSPEIEAALRKVRFWKNVNTVVGVAGSILDIGNGIYMIYNAESQFEKGLLDADLSNYKKMLGVVQIGVGVVGLVMVFSPDPFSKIAAPVVVVVGVVVAALDMWIDHIQAQRVAARQRLMERVAAQDRPRAIRELLIKDMNIQCAL